MSEFTSLRITRSDQTATAGQWVRLEQIIPATTRKYASIQDLYQAWMYAATGKSATRSRQSGSPVEFDGTIVRFFLGFYVWPSAPGLPYQLTTTIGEVGPQQLIELPREFSAFAKNAAVIDLECYMVDVTVVWETPVYDRYGEQIAVPEITNMGNYLKLSHESFGALRVVGKAVGGYHVLTVEVDKGLWDEPEATRPEQTQGDKTFINQLPVNTTNSNKISNIEPTITASWQTTTDNTTDTDQLRLEVPQGVLDVLGWCPGNPLFILDWCQKVSSTNVYYNSCTGEVIKVCDGLDPHKYCTRIELQTDPGPWLRSLL